MKHSIHRCASRSKNLNVFILVFGILLSPALAQIAPARTAEPIDARWTGKVVGITDGDTIKVLTPDNRQVKIRLYGVDAPEKKQAFGTKAKEFLSSLIFGETVEIQPISIDLYGRTIAKVWIHGKDVGLTCIEYGYCWHYVQYCKKCTDYKNAQAKAKKQGLGLWADKNPIAPWKFRKNKGE